MQRRSKVVTPSNLSTFCFEKLLLAIILNDPEQARGPPYLNAIVLPTQTSKNNSHYI